MDSVWINTVDSSINQNVEQITSWFHEDDLDLLSEEKRKDLKKIQVSKLLDLIESIYCP